MCNNDPPTNNPLKKAINIWIGGTKICDNVTHRRRANPTKNTAIDVLMFYID
jgi:hypothetical protein